MTDKFNWFAEDDSRIVLGYQPPTAVYHEGESIRIRQKADETEEYDPEVFLTPHGALTVAWRLIEVAHLAGVPYPSLSLFQQMPDRPPPNLAELQRFVAKTFGKGDTLPEENDPPLLAEMERRASENGEAA